MTSHEDGSQKSEVRSQRSEVSGPTSDLRPPASDLRLPTPGRVVLFVLKDGITIRPAHVIEAEGTACCLQVLLKPLETLSESAYQALVPHCEHGNAGTWHWPRFSSLPSHHGHAVIDPESSGAPGGVTNSPATPHPAAGAGDDRRQFSPDPHRELTGVLNG